MFEHSTINAMKYCTWRFPCRRAICPFCASRKARRQFRELGELVDLDVPALMCRLSVQSSDDLDRAWTDLAAARNAFGVRTWLSSVSNRWWRNTELTLSVQGMWNFHDALIVFGDDGALSVVEKSIASRWAEAADHGFLRVPGSKNEKLDHPVIGGRGVQDVSRVRLPEGARRYSTKGLMKSGELGKGRTPGDVLWEFYHGDADAAEAWSELESFVDRHPRALIWSQRGKGLQQATKEKLRADYALTA
ncbi:hypothetical protein GCM10011600_24480 [Pseudolysinimonas yzui]|uniref:Uncharacterized protein n=2 Tax=Pseudolysinimonas yzui TaxID=2708254 RepID=A0A8J3GRY6_9MICO|nr:hypothetical protein GCM10011600_24480 [Pseudolysinimonas yzui]